MTKENNEIKRAVAMAYSPEDGAPRIVAKGSGVTAEAIISLAREHGVYVHKSEELVQLLMQVDLDHEIPPELDLLDGSAADGELGEPTRVTRVTDCPVSYLPR